MSDAITETNMYKPTGDVPIQGTVVYEDKSVRVPWKGESGISAHVDISNDVYQDKQGNDRKVESSAWVKVGSAHGRSESDSRISGKVIWADEYGVLMGSRTDKGLDMTGVSVVEDEYNPPYGIRVVGLKDDVGTERISNVSDRWRSEGIPTEAIIREVKVEELVVNGQVVSIDQWKQDVVTSIDEKMVNMPEGDKKNDLRKWRERVTEYFDGRSFYAIERAMPVGERIMDLVRCKDQKEANEIFRRVFSWLNAASGVGGNRWNYGFEVTTADGMARKPDSESDEDRLFFVKEWLPKQMGKYLAEIHSRGYAHKFASPHNWTLAAVLVDLDSVRCPEDNPRTSDMAYDLWTTSTQTLSFLLNTPIRVAGDNGNSVIGDMAEDAGLNRSECLFDMVGEMLFSYCQTGFEIVEAGGEQVDLSESDVLGRFISDMSEVGSVNGINETELIGILSERLADNFVNDFYGFLSTARQVSGLGFETVIRSGTSETGFGGVNRVNEVKLMKRLSDRLSHTERFQQSAKRMIQNLNY